MQPQYVLVEVKLGADGNHGVLVHIALCCVLAANGVKDGHTQLVGVICLCLAAEVHALVVCQAFGERAKHAASVALDLDVLQVGG